MSATALKTPGFFEHLMLLWRLRIDVALGRQRGRNRLVAAVSFVSSVTPAVPLFWAAYSMMTWAPLAISNIWSRLAFDLLSFVVFCVWLLWPILSAGVDDHSEITRYRAFPITSLRLLVASTLAGMFEPLALIIFAPMFGGWLGYLTIRPPTSWPVAIALLFLFAAMCTAWSRAALHGILNVLRSHRSAQAIGGGFLVVMAVSLLIPPIDISWLTAKGGDFGGMTPEFALTAAVGLSRVPTGFLGEGLRQVHDGAALGSILELVGLGFFTVIGMFFAYRLLLRFHTADGPAQASPSKRGRRNYFAVAPTRLRALMLRELFDLWRNPRARLLAAVPFVLAVAGKLLSGRQLAAHFVGDATDAWLLGGLCVYGVVVFSLTFAQNMFGYDGRGLAILLAAPVPPREIITAKNAVYAGVTLALAFAISVFYLLYFGAGTFVDWATAMAAVLAMVPMLLLVGNFVSIFYPTRFHANLERRDQQPRAAILTGMLATSVGGAPFVWAMQVATPNGPSLLTVLVIVSVAGAWWILYFLSIPWAVRAFERRRESVLIAVTRD